MKFCGKCGTKMEDEVKFCPGCGAAAEVGAGGQSHTQQSTDGAGDFAAKVAAFNNTADTTADFSADDVAQNKVMAILAYLGPLVLIPIFAAKESKFARYHSNQGLLLLIAAVIYGIVYRILSGIILAISWRLYFITSIIGLVSLVFLALAIIGIVNVVNGRAKELPVIGKIRLLK